MSNPASRGMPTIGGEGGGFGAARHRCYAPLTGPRRVFTLRPSCHPPSFLRIIPMSTLFTPIALRGLNLANRIMVSPMCQYSADDGSANDWHFTHINNLALSGAAMFCIEATHVEAIGRITPGCAGLYSDANEAALKPILASVRKHSKAAVAMQLAHAGRKGSSARPWEGGQQIPLGQEGSWQTVAPSAVPHKEGEAPPTALDDAGLTRI